MALKRLRYEEEGDVFRVADGSEFSFASDGALIVPLFAGADVSVAHFANALERYETYYGAYLESMFISSTPESEFDPETADRDAWISYDRGVISAHAGFVVDPDSVPPEADTASLVAPLLARHRARWDGRWTDDEGNYVSVAMSCSLTGRRRSISELHGLAQEIQDLLNAAGDASALTAHAARDLVRAGRVNLLLGQPEGAWLEAKREPHSLATDADKWELAKDVAAFANAGRDALIVWGVADRQDPQGDVLDTLRPFPMGDVDVPAVRAALRDRLVPMVPDLEVGLVESRQGYGYGFVFIPAQPPELQPFMVTGALRPSAGWLGRHLTIPVGAGEDTAYLDASALHSMLAAGRTALRVPPPTADTSETADAAE